jgi:hypothetical protein
LLLITEEEDADMASGGAAATWFSGGVSFLR